MPMASFSILLLLIVIIIIMRPRPRCRSRKKTNAERRRSRRPRETQETGFGRQCQQGEKSLHGLCSHALSPRAPPPSSQLPQDPAHSALGAFEQSVPPRTRGLPTASVRQPLARRHERLPRSPSARAPSRPCPAPPRTHTPRTGPSPPSRTLPSSPPSPPAQNGPLALLFVPAVEAPRHHLRCAVPAGVQGRHRAIARARVREERHLLGAGRAGPGAAEGAVGCEGEGAEGGVEGERAGGGAFEESGDVADAEEVVAVGEELVGALGGVELGEGGDVLAY